MENNRDNLWAVQVLPGDETALQLLSNEYRDKVNLHTGRNDRVAASMYYDGLLDINIVQSSLLSDTNEVALTSSQRSLLNMARRYAEAEAQRRPRATDTIFSKLTEFVKSKISN